MHKEGESPISNTEIERRFYENEFRIAAHTTTINLQLMRTNNPSPKKPLHEIFSVIAGREIGGVQQEICLSGSGLLRFTEGEKRNVRLVSPVESIPYDTLLSFFSWYKYSEYIEFPEDFSLQGKSYTQREELTNNAIDKFVEKYRIHLTGHLIVGLRDSVDDIRRQYRES